MVVVARSGSFTSAAAELGYTQSAVSQQIQSLEQEVGQALLDRRPVRPTPAGARLIEHAHRILMRVDVARSELANLGGDELTLRVAAAPLAVPAYLAAALRLLRRSSPSVRISIRSSGAGAAVAALAAGEVDVALVDGISAPENPLALAEPGLLVSIGLMEEELRVVLPEGHPMAGRKWIDLAMLADAPWVAGAEHLVESAAPPRLRDGSGRSFAVQEPADLALLLTLVAADHGTALVPASVPMLPAGVVTVPLRRPELVHRTEVLTLRDPPPQASALVEDLRRLVRP